LSSFLSDYSRFGKLLNISNTVLYCANRYSCWQRV
jgi:hypothetical protein